MFNLFYEIFLVIVFFAVFKLYDIYIATMVAIAGSTVQVIGTRLWLKRFDKKQLIVLSILIIFGGMTLYFHNPIFIKWKPTVLFWLMGCVFLFSPFFTSQPLTKSLMGHALEDKHTILPIVWKRLNVAWALFFILLGSVNVFVAYYCSTNTWVNFKVYGILGALFIFTFAQSFYLAKHIARHSSSHDNK